MSTEFQSSTTEAQPVAGAAVYSSDGEQFAYVAEVRGGYFKLDVPMARDYWLSFEYIERATATEVHLNIRRNDVGEHQLEEPGIEPANDPHEDVSDTVLSDADALVQRERMEHEIELQRERMFKERAEDVGLR